MGLDIGFFKIKNVADKQKSMSELIDHESKKVRDRYDKATKKALDELAKTTDKDEFAALRTKLLTKTMARYTGMGWILKDAAKKDMTFDELSKMVDDFRTFAYRNSDAYFRKVNFIYRYFSDKLEDEACYCTYNDLEELVERCDKVLKDHDLAEELLPTQSGFFFGSTDYDKWYFDDVKDCKKQISKLLKGFDESKDVIFVDFSW